MVLFGGNKDGNNGENYKIKTERTRTKIRGKGSSLKKSPQRR
jgi:hypothetical protein